MKVSYAFLGLAALVLAAMAYIRFTPVHEGSGAARPDAKSPGDYARQGGFYAARASGEIDLEKLEATILATPRTVALAPGVYASRSLIWAFPDITHVWQENGNLHVFSHLVYGRKDFGVNKTRLLRWLESARA